MSVTSVTLALTDMTSRLGAAWVSAQPGDPDPTSGRGAEWGKAAPAGLLVWLFLGVSLFFLIKSMNKHFKRVPASFDAAPEPESAGVGRVDPARDVEPADPGDGAAGDGAGASPSGSPSGAQSRSPVRRSAS